MGISEQIIDTLNALVQTEYEGYPNRLAKRVGITVQQLGRWLTGETSPQLEKIGPVLDALGFTLAPPGERQAALQREVQFLAPRILSAELGTPPPASDDYFAVPLAESPVAAGPGLINEDQVRGWIIVWRHHESIRFRTDLVAVEIGRGETSMTPTLHPGDIVLVDRAERLPDPDGKIMLTCDPDGGCAIKRVSTRKVDGDIELVFYSDNGKEFPPRVQRLGRDYGGELAHAIGGRVVWAWSDMTRK
ncbi:MAG: helix-turn-helix domain-containing protein [Humidesulfovibrio sp.]|uniref:LexA family transcriptional regulator n=1 Tax=Humidesulfovibrio sp. TaxID=2910988 RepID=UPI0027E76E5D|nr:helix-turn-helix domain-containing protein [Humidesulfovibrio sp.]MDQ7835501.1 helix-turn-helix domain-containing protein [Humidesulfovibrio sp.]